MIPNSQVCHFLMVNPCMLSSKKLKVKNNQVPPQTPAIQTTPQQITTAHPAVKTHSVTWGD